jgi:hypothetical protein
LSDLSAQPPIDRIPLGSRIRIGVAALLLLSTLLVATRVTGAIFTSTASVGANAFTAGSVNISTSPASALLTLSAMAPGDIVTSSLTVSNAGSLQLRYAIASTTTENTLAAQLALTIKSGVTTCTTAGFAASGTVLYGPGVLGTTTGTNVVGDPTQGAQAGDRTLNASANEVLCFQASLPLATGNGFQGLTTTATLAFSAEQTANN